MNAWLQSKQNIEKKKNLIRAQHFARVSQYWGITEGVPLMPFTRFPFSVGVNPRHIAIIHQV